MKNRVAGTWRKQVEAWLIVPALKLRGCSREQEKGDRDNPLLSWRKAVARIQSISQQRTVSGRKTWAWSKRRTTGNKETLSQSVCACCLLRCGRWLHYWLVTCGLFSSEMMFFISWVRFDAMFITSPCFYWFYILCLQYMTVCLGLGLIRLPIFASSLALTSGYNHPTWVWIPLLSLNNSLTPATREISSLEPNQNNGKGPSNGA